TRTLKGLRAGLAVIARVPLLAPLAPLLLTSSSARGGSGLTASLAVPREVGSQRRPTAIIVVGSLLLAANVYCGFNRIISWPFSVYPQFDSIIRSATCSSIEAVVRNSQGETRTIEIDLPGLVLEHVRREHSDTRIARLQAVKDLMADNHLTLQPGETLQFFEITRSTIPEERHRPPLQRELLWEFRPQAGGAGNQPPPE
ncbi:MAG TPA: hypothetical protein VL403_11300, partial [Candidatus Kryptonia bacterium]|nr:hypothetical protein [Candidatus Kryptonia bacterium]